MVIMAAVAISAASCGGAKPLTHRQYEATVRRLLAEGSSAIAQINSDQSASLAATVRNVEREASEMRSIATQLARIDPPDDAKHANGLLITGFDETADELTALASAAKAKDQTKFRAIRAQLLDRTPPGLSDVLEGSRELVAAGYRLGP